MAPTALNPTEDQRLHLGKTHQTGVERQVLAQTRSRQKTRHTNALHRLKLLTQAVLVTLRRPL